MTRRLRASFQANLVLGRLPAWASSDAMDQGGEVAQSVDRDSARMDEHASWLVLNGVNWPCGLGQTKRNVASMRGQHRLPDFSVVVWIKKNENFPTLRSEVLAAAGAEPYEMTEYHGMADFYWATSSVVDARKLAEALKVVCQRPEVVLLRIISLVDDVESILIKDERVTKR